MLFLIYINDLPDRLTSTDILKNKRYANRQVPDSKMLFTDNIKISVRLNRKDALPYWRSTV